jgi:3-methyladenine DNA glycosylase AlkD
MTSVASARRASNLACAAVLRELEGLGTAQNRKVYGWHGVKTPMFGVSFAHLNKIDKRIKTDHELAREPWASGNHDARVLAALIADPQAARAA